MSSNPTTASGKSAQSAKPAARAPQKPDVPDEEAVQLNMDSQARSLGIRMGVYGLVLAGIFAFWAKFLGTDMSRIDFFGNRVGVLTIIIGLRFVFPLVLGLVGSLSVVRALFSSRAGSRFATPFYLAVVGLAVSASLLVVQELDVFNILNLGSLSWLYPTSVLGITLAVLSLAMGGTGSKRDKTISMVAAVIPPILLSVPLFVTLSSFSLSDYTLAAYLLSGIAVVLSGIRLDTLFEIVDESTLVQIMDAYGKKMGRYTGFFGLILAGLYAYQSKSIAVDAAWPSLWGYPIDERSFVIEMYWVLPLVIGLTGSVFIFRTLFKSREAPRFRVPFYIAVVGIILSSVVLTLQQLDAFQVIDLGWHAWLYPVSVLGIGLAMVSLALSGTGSRRDKWISAIAAFVPPVLLSLPFFVTLSWAATVDFLLAAYFLSGVSIIASGVKLGTLYEKLELGKLAKWSGISIGALLLFALAVSWAPRLFFLELRWLAPAAGGVAVSALAAWTIHTADASGRPRLQGKSGYISYLSLFGYLASLAVLTVVCLNGLEVLDLGSAEWLYLASIAGTSLAMISLSLAGEGDWLDRVLSVVTSLIPVGLLSLPLALDLDPARDSDTFTQILIASAIAFGLSGINLHKAYVDAHVLREKLKLTVLRTFKVMKQVMANPMGVVGVAILMFFVIMAAFGPALAPYEIPEGVGQFEKYLKPYENATAAPSYIAPIKYALPLAAGALSSLVVLGVVSRSTADTGRRVMSYYVSLLALVFSSVLLLVILLDAWGVIGIGYPGWLLPVSLVGVTLVFLSIAIVRADKSLKSMIGIVAAIAATAVLVVPATMDLSTKAMAGALLGTFILSGILIILSGTVLLSFYKGLKIGWTSEGTESEKLVFSMGRTAKLFGALVGPTIFLAGIVAYLEGNWTTHWMGTDTFGYDVFSELLVGARTSIIVGIFSAMIASVLGALVGLYSGYVGGWTDEVIMRANDVVLSIPWLVLMIIVAAMLGKIDLTGIILIIGLTGWSATARMVRAQVLSIRERQFIERARAIGSSDMAIVRRHVLPNAFPLVFANTILTVAVSILSEATLSFLGMRPVGVVTWGTMLSYASSANAFHIGLQWWIIAPGMCIVIIVLGFTLLGYALDDILNPKLRKR